MRTRRHFEWDPSDIWESNIRHLRNAGTPREEAYRLAEQQAQVPRKEAAQFWRSLEIIDAIASGRAAKLRAPPVAMTLRSAKIKALRAGKMRRTNVADEAAVPRRSTERRATGLIPVRALQGGAFLVGVASVSRLDGLTFQPLRGKASNSALLLALTLGAGVIARQYPRRKQLSNGLFAASAGLGVGMLVKANRKAAAQ